LIPISLKLSLGSNQALQTLLLAFIDTMRTSLANSLFREPRIGVTLVSITLDGALLLLEAAQVTNGHSQLTYRRDSRSESGGNSVMRKSGLMAAAVTLVCIVALSSVTSVKQNKARVSYDTPQHSLTGNNNGSVLNTVTQDEESNWVQEAYPVPLPTSTPVDPTKGRFVGVEARVVAEEIVRQFENRGWTKGPTTIKRAIDVYEQDAKDFKIQEQDIAKFGEPDVVVLLQGSFSVNLPGFNRTGRNSYPFLMAVVDRTTGKSYQITAFEDENELPERLR